MKRYIVPIAPTFPKKVENGMIEDALNYCNKLLDVISSDETIEKTRQNGLEVDTVLGDTVYSSQKNLKLAKSEDNSEKSFQLISKLNPVISNSINNSERNGFIFNKDTGLFIGLLFL